MRVASHHGGRYPVGSAPGRICPRKGLSPPALVVGTTSTFFQLEYADIGQNEEKLQEKIVDVVASKLRRIVYCEECGRRLWWAKAGETPMRAI